MKPVDTSIHDILNPEVDFYKDVNACIKAGGECMDCIISWCDDTKIEMEQIIPLIKTSVLKKELLTEAVAKHFIKKRKTRKKKE